MDRPRIEHWPQLPIVEHRDEIAETVRAHPVVVICGETGSGKSTQLPKICLDAGRGGKGVIGQTQPRRIAARTIAQRIADELGTPLGSAVGYKVRFSDRTRRDGFIKVMTDGILLAETQGDRRLERYDTIIIDEAHERSLNIDFLLGYLKRLLRRRRDLKVIITSATLDPERLSAHFDGAPVIEVSGRTYPVEVRYRPLESTDADERDRDMLPAILDAVDELAAEGPGDVLVFLSGEREIREASEALRKHHPHGTSILPLYARLSAAEQSRVFEPHGGRRIVLATNVAETSLTVPGIRAVVDPGLARISRYSARSKVQRLPVEAISQASARQRAGRCGRLGPGVCIRLYAERDFDQREEFTLPEIQRTNLASVVLQMTALGLGEVERFPFVDPPRRVMIRDGFETLRELGAIDADRKLTPIGRALARLPIDPRVGRMILAAMDEGCLDEVLTIAAALSIQDPRERPMDRRDAADEAHRVFADESSDFLAYLRLWDAWHEQRRHLSWNKLRAWCRGHFVSFMRMREWIDIRRQLHALVTQTGHHLNREPADEDAIHRALLAGLLSNVGLRGERREYSGARGSAFHVFPGSVLFRKPPKWAMAAEIVETTRRYARCVARIQPEWIERVGSHLVNRTYSEPDWDAATGRVVARERVTLFGLDVVTRRRVHYGPIDPVASREIFIHRGLVEGELRTDAAFLDANRALVEEIRAVEAKRRRRDVLVDAQSQYDFYDRHLPADVWSAGGFESWRRKAERGTPDRLRMTRADLTLPGAEEVDPDAFPETLAVGDARLPLSYALEPGGDDDGVTVTVPTDLLGLLAEEQLEWTVPGLLEEKIVALIRALPKHLRRGFVPVPDVARACRGHLAFGRGRLTAALGEVLRERTGVTVPPEAWRADEVPDHLRLRVRVVDAAGAERCAGRDLAELRRSAGADTGTTLTVLADERFGRTGITAWDFDPLPATVTLERSGARLTGHPALVDDGAAVSLHLLETPEAARTAMRSGLRRLFALAAGSELAQQIQHLPEIERLRLLAAPLGAPAELDDALRLLIAEQAFGAGGDDVRDRETFERRLEAGFPRLWEVGGVVADTVLRVLEAHHEVQLQLALRDKPVWAEIVVDERAHLDRLLPAGFLVATPTERLHELPRYLAAVLRRLEKLTGGGLTRDRAAAAELEELHARYERRRADHADRGITDPALDDFRWLVEEYRVSLFAQDLGTAVPVSPKRLEKAWAEVRP
ncbi:MAG: ATP-dependent RNA helicase HrpA [Planctomycetes bacterium]|nr:ATP-dependent RNA helicase HrpA [Planctomycetota bacterium]